MFAAAVLVLSWTNSHPTLSNEHQPRPPLVLHNEDGFVVSRGHTGGTRVTAITCRHTFTHACFGMAPDKKTFVLLTNDTRKNSESFLVGDYWAKQDRMTRQVKVMRVSTVRLQQIGAASQWVDGAMIVFTDWNEQNHLGHFTMVAGIPFEYKTAFRTCLADRRDTRGLCGNASLYWTMQPNDELWEGGSNKLTRSTASNKTWVRKILPHVLGAAFGPLCQHAGAELRVSHSRRFPKDRFPACAANVHISAWQPTAEVESARTRLPLRSDWKQLRARLESAFNLTSTPRKECTLLIAQHQRRMVAEHQIRAAAEAAGFTSVKSRYLGTLSIAEQLHSVASARVIISREGSHLANLVAAHSDTVLVPVSNCGVFPDIMWMPYAMGMTILAYRNTDARLLELAPRGVYTRPSSRFISARMARCNQSLTYWQINDPANCNLMPDYFCEVRIGFEETRLQALLHHAAALVGCSTPGGQARINGKLPDLSTEAYGWPRRGSIWCPELGGLGGVSPWNKTVGWCHTVDPSIAKITTRQNAGDTNG